MLTLLMNVPLQDCYRQNARLWGFERPRVNLGWTEVEKEAVRQGVRVIGVGHWAQIKKRFAQELFDRTPIQIKVRGQGAFIW